MWVGVRGRVEVRLGLRWGYGGVWFGARVTVGVEVGFGVVVGVGVGNRVREGDVGTCRHHCM